MKLTNTSFGCSSWSCTRNCFRSKDGNCLSTSAWRKNHIITQWSTLYVYNGIICSLVGYLWSSNCVWTIEPWVSFPKWKSICYRLMNSQIHRWWCDDTNCNNNSPPVWYCFCAKEGNVCKQHTNIHHTQYKNCRHTKLTVGPLGSSDTLCPAKANLLGWNSAHNHEKC